MARTARFRRRDRKNLAERERWGQWLLDMTPGFRQSSVEEKTNEIPKLPELLAPLPLEGALITADALHTQTESASYIVEQKKADYLFIVKENQPTLHQDICDLKLESFPPSAHDNR